MYTDFIKNKLLPELTLLATKYATWWTFKPDSLLKSYLDDREINLDKYFRPQELLKHVLNVLKKETQFSNNNVIVLMDEEQQRVFDSWFIFVPDIILTHLLTHVTTASSEIADSLQNKHMIADFYIDSPTDIIYKDPSSVFWLTPVVDFAINESTGNVYSWKKLLARSWTGPENFIKILSFHQKLFNFLIRTDRQTHRDTHRQADRQKYRQAGKQTDRQKDRQAGKQIGRKADRER